MRAVGVRVQGCGSAWPGLLGCVRRVFDAGGAPGDARKPRIAAAKPRSREASLREARTREKPRGLTRPSRAPGKMAPKTDVVLYRFDISVALATAPGYAALSDEAKQYLKTVVNTISGDSSATVSAWVSVLLNEVSGPRQAVAFLGAHGWNRVGIAGTR